MYIISGRMKVVMDDGTQSGNGPGDVAVIPPGHNAWVIGDEPCVFVDLSISQEPEINAKKLSLIRNKY